MTSFNKQQARVAIVGAGTGGLTSAIALKKQLGFTNFVIYEKAEGVGGTWWHNTYPGCGSDVAVHWYSLSSDLNPNWNKYLASQPDILEYWDGLTNKYGIRPHILFSTSFERAEWDEAAQVYRLTLRDVKSGKVWHDEAEMVVSATGALSVPVFPADIPGREDFKGIWFHSAKWRHDVSLSGKRVGVIGNGCSAAQFVPRISKDESVKVINFCRTPQWYLYWDNFTYPGWAKWVFTYIPLTLRAYRLVVYSTYEALAASFQYTKAHRATSWSVLNWAANAYMDRAIPEKYKHLLKPSYPAGCRRIIIDPGYLPALHRPNVELTYEQIDRVIPEGLLLKNGQTVPLDVIIFATGFNTKIMGPETIGRNGVSLDEYFKSQGGPTAYLGTTVPGFPNFFIMMGPNTVTGHASVIYTEETQINYSIKLMKPVIERKAQSFEVTESACNKYNEDIQRRLTRTVFPHCSSWYQGGRGRNAQIFPGPVTMFWLWTLRMRWGDYTAVGAEKFTRERRIRKALKAIGLLIFVVLISLKYTKLLR